VSREKLHDLRHQCDLAAYAVLGASRVLVLTLDKATAWNTAELIKKYDEARKALEVYEKAEREAGAVAEIGGAP